MKFYHLLSYGFSLLQVLIEKYLSNLIARYKLEQGKIKEILQNENKEQNEKTIEVMDEIGKKRGAVISGGEIDRDRVANILLEDFRSGKLGKITLEETNK